MFRFVVPRPITVRPKLPHQRGCWKARGRRAAGRGTASRPGSPGTGEGRHRSADVTAVSARRREHPPSPMTSSGQHDDHHGKAPDQQGRPALHGIGPPLVGQLGFDANQLSRQALVQRWRRRRVVGRRPLRRWSLGHRLSHGCSLRASLRAVRVWIGRDHRGAGGPALSRRPRTRPSFSTGVGHRHGVTQTSRMNADSTPQTAAESGPLVHSSSCSACRSLSTGRPADGWADQSPRRRPSATSSASQAAPRA